MALTKTKTLKGIDIHYENPTPFINVCYEYSIDDTEDGLLPLRHQIWTTYESDCDRTGLDSTIQGVMTTIWG